MECLGCRLVPGAGSVDIVVLVGVLMKMRRIKEVRKCALRVDERVGCVCVEYGQRRWEH